MNRRQGAPAGLTLVLALPPSAVTFVPVSTVSGQAEADDILAAVRPATCLVTVMLANNETGVVMVSRFFLSRTPGGEARPALLVPSRPAAGPRLAFGSVTLVACPRSGCLPPFTRFSSHPGGMLSSLLSPPQPVPEISRRVQALNQERAASGRPVILLHTDAAQALGKRRVDVEDLGVDLLTIVGHKVRTPRGDGWVCPWEPALDAVTSSSLSVGAHRRGTSGRWGGIHRVPNPHGAGGARPLRVGDAGGMHADPLWALCPPRTGAGCSLPLGAQVERSCGDSPARRSGETVPDDPAEAAAQPPGGTAACAFQRSVSGHVHG